MRYRDITKEQPLEGDPILFWAAKAGKWFDTTYSRAFSDGFRWWIPQIELPYPPLQELAKLDQELGLE